MRIVLFFLLLATFVYAKQTYRIAFVVDGKAKQYEVFEKGLKSEIKKLLARDFKVLFPKSKHYYGDWNYKKIASIIDKELRSSSSDMIVTIGVLSSSYAAKKRKLPKPVVATMVIDPQMQGIPLNSRRNISNRHNLNYIRPFGAVDDDIATIQEIFAPRSAAVCIDERLFSHDKKIASFLQKKFEQKIPKVQVVIVGRDVKKAVEKIDPSTDIVYVAPLLSLDKKRKKEFYSLLAAKKLKTFAAQGAGDVELGALLADNGKTDLKKFTRQIALNIQQIALGSDAGVQDVNFVTNKSIYINLPTASKIGFKPSWELLSRATIVDQAEGKKNLASLESIMEIAIRRNLDIKAADLSVGRSKAQYKRAKSGYLPQLNIGVEARQIDQDRAAASLGLLNETNFDAYLLFAQQIYNQKLFSQVSINKHFLKSQMCSEDFVKLQIALQASQQYLNILKLENTLKIQKQNLELTKQNLKAAKVRLQIGVGSVKDIYRWESKLANDKNTLLQTLVNVKQAKNTLLTLMNFNSAKDLNLDDVEIDNPVFMTHHTKMQEYFLNQQKFEKLKSYLLGLAEKNMPSLAQYDEIVHTKREAVEMEEKVMYIPTVSVEGGVRTHFIQSSNTVRDDDPNLQKYPYADNTDWNIGVYVRYPLYEGGAQKAQIESAKFDLERTYAKRNKLKNDITNNLLNALYQSRALFLSIKLAKEALESSRKNLAVTQDIYNQGNSSIIYLLDAQSDTLRAALQLNDIKYSFLKYLLTVQYYTGQVNFDLDDAQWSEWYSGLIALSRHDILTEKKENTQ